MRKMIETRVCIDDDFGPFDCKLDPSNGFLAPRFSLEVARQVAAQTLRLAGEYGHDCVDTVHVIEGRADSPETVHVIKGGPSGEEGEDLAVAVRVNWRHVGRGTARAATITDATPQARKAARRRKPGGRGARRAVVVHVRWMYMAEGSDTAASVILPDREGLFPIGGGEWTWGFAAWWCLCGARQDWHVPGCDCGVTRDQALALREAAPKVGAILRTLAPGASAVLFETHGVPRLTAVVDGATELDLGERGPFDAETLGEADAVLRGALGGEPVEGGPHWLRLTPESAR
ncbi:hypothetical protein WDH52_06635 [Streptomyces sp. TRM70308]|uniref:hypothetical protein n=1 Tax=Streptomyces sp. TRM70308 TaxID=3131932 RepID=UPI003D0620C9